MTTTESGLVGSALPLDALALGRRPSPGSSHSTPSATAATTTMTVTKPSSRRMRRSLSIVSSVPPTDDPST